MDRIDQIYVLHHILAQRRYSISRNELERQQECTRATVEYLRYFLGAPIKYARKASGYFYDSQGKPIYEFPNFWFNRFKLNILLITQGLLHLVRYRCRDSGHHNRNVLRSLSLDRIKQTTANKQADHLLKNDTLDLNFIRTYGIFSGQAKEIVRLKLTGQHARWRIVRVNDYSRNYRYE